MATVIRVAIIPARTELIPTQIDPGRQVSGDISPAVPGPETIGRWALSTVEYRLRCRTRSVGQMLHVSLPLPASPRTQVEVTSSGDQIYLAEISGTPDVPASRKNPTSFVFPVMFNSEDLVVRVQTQASAQAARIEPAEVNVTCVSETSPQQKRLTCTYEVTSPRSLSDELSVQIPESYRVTDVRDADGRNISWSIKGRRLALRYSEGTGRSAQFTVSLTSELSPLALTSTIDVQSVSDMTDAVCTQVSIVARASAGFYVKAVEVDGQSVSDTPVGDEEREADGLRANDRLFVVNPTAQSASVQIAEQSDQSRGTGDATGSCWTGRSPLVVPVRSRDSRWVCFSRVDIPRQ